jgi:hypothetical protein
MKKIVEEDKQRYNIYLKQKKIYDSDVCVYQAQQVLLNEHNETIVSNFKKAKAIKKKLRDIQDLKQKIESQGISTKSLTTEQKEKLKRQQSLEDDLGNLSHH